MAVFHDLVVERVEPVTEDSVALTLAVPPDLADAYAFRPGQHLTFRHDADGTEVRRTFSICSTPSSGRLQVAIKYLAGGLFSGYVRDHVRAGSALSVMTPVGRFVPRALREGAEAEPGPHRYVAVCAGSGITPVLSIMATLLETEPDCEFVLIYGNRRASSVMFAEEIGDLKDRFLARLVVYHVLSREPHEAPLLSGRIDAAKLADLLAQHPPETVTEWFLCGPSPLVQLTAAFLGESGVSRRRIHTEIFFVGPDVPAGPPGGSGTTPDAASGTLVSARLDGRTSEYRLAPGEAVLDGLLRVRSDAPYACRGGVCGTCRMRLVDGVVELRQNYALDPNDLDAGFRLACQSDPRTPRLVVDFDV